MATIKSYTDLSQSRTLSKIIPLESADYHYIAQGEKSYFYPYSLSSDDIKDYDEEIKYIPCWSLVALLGVLSLPDLIQDKAEGELFWQCSVYNEDGTLLCETYDNNPIDACVAMIESLNKIKML